MLFRPGAPSETRNQFIGAVKGTPLIPNAQITEISSKIFPNIISLTPSMITELRKRLSDLSFVVSFIGGFVCNTAC
ncbi:MAG: hypothetical protein U0Y68_17970 [Blastocatellia bacterium]